MDKENKTQIDISQIQQYDSATLMKFIKEANKLIQARDNARRAELIDAFLAAGKQLLVEFPHTTLYIEYEDEDGNRLDIDLLDYFDGNLKARDFGYDESIF
jgi:hypothetical protein